MCLVLDQFLWGHSSRVCDISCFSKINVFKKVLGSTKGVHQTFMDPVQDQFSVGPDLGLNCLQVISADIKSYL